MPPSSGGTAGAGGRRGLRPADEHGLALRRPKTKAGDPKSRNIKTDTDTEIHIHIYIYIEKICRAKGGPEGPE